MAWSDAARAAAAEARRMHASGMPRPTAVKTSMFGKGYRAKVVLYGPGPKYLPSGKKNTGAVYKGRLGYLGAELFKTRADAVRHAKTIASKFR